MTKAVRTGALAATLVLACSPANVGNPADSGAHDDAAHLSDGGVTVAQACKLSAYARCTRLEACSPTAMQLRYGSTSACEAIIGEVCARAMSAPASGATPASAQACTQALPGWACNDFLYNQNIPPGCQQPMGTLPNGSACGVHQQCQSGYCGLPPDRACGTCASPPQIGDSCAQRVCPQSLTCVAATKTCAAFAQIGAPCSASQPCSAGLTCVGATPSGSGRCEQGVSTQGTACVSIGAGCDINAGLSCNLETNTCVLARLAGPGQACGTVANQAAYCISGSCMRGACLASAPLGDACDPDTGPQCSDSARCVASSDAGTNRTCQVNGTTACR